MAAESQRLVVGLSGSSAPQLGEMFLRVCRDIEGLEAHLVMSNGARRSIKLEMGEDPSVIEELATVAYDPADMGAAISSGSFLTIGMVVIPCSMGALGGIAAGTSTDLLRRAADVTLKERRPLVLCIRETPLNKIHIRNMSLAADAGATIFPLIPTFYNHPPSADAMAHEFANRVLAHLGLAQPDAYHWKSQ